LKRTVFLTIAITIASLAQLVSARAGEPKPTIVLVHGAWADGSSWDGVVRRLLYCGYTVDVPPNAILAGSPRFTE